MSDKKDEKAPKNEKSEGRELTEAELEKLSGGPIYVQNNLLLPAVRSSSINFNIGSATGGAGAG